MPGHGKRRCPVDGQRLIEDRIDPFHRDVVVDACALCHGMFLDKGELLALTKNKVLALRLRKAAVDRDSAHTCPGCGAAMDAEDADGITVDICMSCQGIWLDGGELAHLEALRDGVTPRPAGTLIARMLARWV